MIYLAFALNVLIVAAFVFELREGRKERQQLALLIKSRDVQEFVRAETRLAQPAIESLITTEPDLMDIDDPDVDPVKVAAALQGNRVAE